MFFISVVSIRIVVKLLFILKLNFRFISEFKIFFILFFSWIEKIFCWFYCLVEL